jgi:hypothetical protein
MRRRCIFLAVAGSVWLAWSTGPAGAEVTAEALTPIFSGP